MSVAGRTQPFTNRRNPLSHSGKPNQFASQIRRVQLIGLRVTDA